MTKTVIRASAVLLSAAVFITLLAAALAAPIAMAASGDKPVFSITADRESASTGSKIVVSVAMDNDTPNDITNFTGELLFDTRFFRYVEFEDQLIMDGTVKVVADQSASGKLGFVYTGKELSNSRINSGDSVVFIKFIFSVITTYDTTGQFFIGTLSDCYSGETNLGTIDCKAQSITVRSTTAAVPTQSTTAPQNLSGDARLSGLTISGCQLTPAFNAEFVAYSATVPYEISSVRIEATANSSGAIVSGIGAKDLSVGLNNFTITVLAENGAAREYGIIINRLEQTAETSTTAPTETTSSVTEMTTTLPTETTTVPAPTTTFTQPDGSTVIESEDDRDAADDVLQIVGIVFGEIALFFFGFLSGFFVDKNLRRKGERADYDDDEDYYDDEEDDYDRGPTVFTPSEPMYPDGGYPAPPPQYADPQLIQYNQFGMDGSMVPDQMDATFQPYQQNGQVVSAPMPGMPMPGAPNPPYDPQFGQNQPMYPENGFGGYDDDPYYH